MDAPRSTATEGQNSAELVAQGSGGSSPQPEKFTVSVQDFTGPFDLLLTLVAKHQLDVTIMALAEVTDDFLAYLDSWPDLAQATEFLVIAATLLDIKTARLLPDGQVSATEDLELLEARDLLFSRLLQYRAFKEASFEVSAKIEEARGHLPAQVPLNPNLRKAVPQVHDPIDPIRLARIAAEAIFAAPPAVLVSHLHDPLVSVSEQVAILEERIRKYGHTSFRRLVEDADTTALIVSRFLAILDLFRQGVIRFTQIEPLGDLTISWRQERDRNEENSTQEETWD
ncbi:MAG: ScpA family protein [Actinomycetaceae bacterium]|nr:ScpA family protein [Actinomycetaceae bacterium]